MSIPQTILDIPEICAKHKLGKLVLSPGSRNAPLTLAFNRHPSFNPLVISDERAAGYLALGISQSDKLPAILLSTSGTAALNYGPAIAEAYYQNTPLLILTADRPPEWIDQNDGQAIRQYNVFNNHVKKSFQLPVDLEHPDAQWQVYRTINEAIILAVSGKPGPVHINIPFREPLYPGIDQSEAYDKMTPAINFRPTTKDLTDQQWNSLKEQWSNANKILIVGGQVPFSQNLSNYLLELQDHCKVPVLGGVTSNLHNVHHSISHLEIILGSADSRLEALRPDLLISFGGGYVSKNLKLFLRNHPPTVHWHIQDTPFPPDPFRTITDILPLDPAIFFLELKKKLPIVEHSPWYDKWQKQERLAAQFIEEFIEDTEFCELKAVHTVLAKAKGMHLHLANSTPVRWVNLIGVAPETIEVSSNRGTSGIDGCSSTAVGHALSNDRENLLITGDMALFYDRNAFWHQYKLPNLKIVLLNNHGGGIFRLIAGPSEQPELEALFVTNQSLTADNFAKDFGMKYLYCDNAGDLSHNLDLLFQSESQALMEIVLPANMSDIYQKLILEIKNRYE